MFGESSRPPPEAASASRRSPAPVFSRAPELGGEWPFGGVRWLIPLVGGQPLHSRLPGGDADALSRRHLLGPDPALGVGGGGKARGGGGEGAKVRVGLGWMGGRGSRTWVRLCAGLGTWPRRLGMGAEVGARRREEEGVGDNVRFV